MFRREKMDSKKFTIDDVATNLGLSKTTVSRAISGKGRISQSTRDRVAAYIKEIGYVPSLVARGLAKSRTYNIAFAMPGDGNAFQMPFFQQCLWGISNRALDFDYDVLLAMTSENDISQLQRLVRNQKIDGVILGRTSREDKAQEFLKENKIPFVAIGTSEDEMVHQIDDDQIAACSALTGRLIDEGYEKLGILCNADDSMISLHRLQGYVRAFSKRNQKAQEEQMVFVEDGANGLEKAVDVLMKNGTDCIICMDDSICSRTLDYLKVRNISVPMDIGIASFYDSSLLDHNTPGITTLKFNAQQLGKESCEMLIEVMDGNSPDNKRIREYQIALKGSTQRK